MEVGWTSGLCEAVLVPRHVFLAHATLRLEKSSTRNSRLQTRHRHLDAMAAKTQTTKAPSVPPNQTLYCSNLPDKLQKEQLRRALYMLFSMYGPVLDIIALKEVKHRGQAHIVFRDVQASTQAMRALQGFEFFGKEMVSITSTSLCTAIHP